MTQVRPDRTRRGGRVGRVTRSTPAARGSSVGPRSQPSQDSGVTHSRTARPSIRARARGTESSAKALRGSRSRGGHVAVDSLTTIAPAPSRGDHHAVDTHNTSVATALPTEVVTPPIHVVSDGEGATGKHLSPVRDVSPLAAVVSLLRENHRHRQDYHSAEKRLTLQIKSIQRRSHAAAGCQKPTHAKCPGIYDEATPTTTNLVGARVGFEVLRKGYEKEMEKAAKALPIYPWVKSVRGLGALGLAQVVAECGDLSNYSNPAKLWKRMGVGLSLEGSSYYEGRSPRRRAILYCIGDCIVKAGGELKTLYDERKAFEASKPACRRQFKDGGECYDPETNACRKSHLHNKAKRFMEKRVLRDMWREWNRLAKQ